MYSKPLYDPVKEFETLSLVARNPRLMVVHPSFNVKNIEELIVLAKAQAGVVNWAYRWGSPQ